MANAALCTNCGKYTSPEFPQCLGCGASLPGNGSSQTMASTNAPEPATAKNTSGLYLAFLVIGLIAAVYWGTSFLGGSDVAVSDQTSSDRNAKEFAWMEEAKDQVRARMRDGDSAQFRNVAIHRFQGAPLVCGEVNGKNGFGGFAGFERFIFAGSVGTFVSRDMAPGEMDKSWALMCSG